MKKLTASLIILILFPQIIFAQEPPKLNITISHPDKTAPGVILFTPANDFAQIVGNAGQSLYLSSEASYFDFRMQGDGTLSYRTPISGVFSIVNLDRHYQVIEIVQPVGYDEGIDNHEIIKLGPGHWIYFVYDRIEPFDLSPYGGYMTATLVSTVIQEQENGIVLFEWRDLDHVPLTDSFQNLAKARVDYTHGNGFDIDADGNILASFRHTSQVLKIDRTTGAVLWRLGGVANEFTFVNDPGFSLNHNVRRLDNGHITLFDNGDVPRGYSRAVEYELDEMGKLITATRVITGPFGQFGGSVQRLGNDNTLVSWGSSGVVSEYAPGGEIVWQGELESGWSYRVYRQTFPAWRLWLPGVWR